MTQSKRQEGLCAPLFFATIALLVLAGSVIAQTVDRSELELCASLETSALKLACFEAIVAAGETEGEQLPVSTEPPMSESEPPMSDSGTTKIEVGPETVITLAAPPPAATPPAAVTVTQDAAAGSDFGQEQLKSPGKEDKELIKATVIAVNRGSRNILYFHLANGHVWRQIEPRYFPYPKEGEFEIDITRGMMGEYRLRLSDGGRMVKIRRIE